METALLAAISMGRDLLQKNIERPSLAKQSPESEHNPDRRIAAQFSTVTGFHQDEDGHWVAELSCGHTQHLRHQPPWQSRAWVLDPAQRIEKIGQPFDCGWCAQGSVSDNLGD
ncbi:MULTISPECIES: DUF3565 domain-containing protein [unclassified Pseudomonas]|jgi:hypothetical protein|uniref:DUF3565 domain-containing protein n=1 Tax=unclassified Pseudomonas TaxID=196821 RepID=UPI0019115203|nr:MULTISPECIES: DUF3565 domain-containing protein [unclassified Pseudomonas]MBK5510332.1 DUF3565 domain-containing protein [Pseudomonas sp. TH15]MBK5549528.1 DUF3565 domain-containing protein [Pseudomonas sp. TH03]MEB0228781.1 DUF3565 domain-containing protein [Pseudomonas sp. 5S1]MEB0297988.1 DUF3565 domain-containing protein [Pseudomonas sp. 10S4]WPX20799.1 DUF3565 domain-containing protein [Pseudomonas sp. 10S4]